MDEIRLSLPRGRHLCYAEHQVVARLADVMVTFGQLGTSHTGRLWPQCWGRTFAMCADCCTLACTVATACRPCLVICDTRPGRDRKAAGDQPV